jgi:membrane fusion protein (multidrug efflux system)
MSETRVSPIDQEAVSGAGRATGLARWRWPLMIGGPVLILGVVAWFILTGGRSEATDDAYVQMSKAPISTAVSGRVIEIDVAENQRVKAGQVLFRLDPADLQAAAARAEAGMAVARLQVTTLRSAVDNARLQLAEAQKTQAYAAREAARQDALVAAGVASREQAAAAAHSAELAASQVSIARQNVATALGNLGPGAGAADAFPAVMQASAARQTTQVDLSHTVVYAPVDGVVTRVDQLQLGAYVNASQTLFFLLSGTPWVEANFKENQLTHMRVGQPAVVAIDALGGRELRGHVASFAPGAGSAFSALPAQNATGNWVKVAQRLPVRIAFDKAPPEVGGRAGLSAKVTVDVRSGRKEH